MVNRDKYKELVLYICEKCDSVKLGAIKLNKVLWFSDLLAYVKWGEPITGERYVKRQFGPAPYGILSVLEELQGEGALTVKSLDFYGYQKTHYIPERSADLSQFTVDELSLVDGMIGFVCDSNTALSISELTHDHIWEIAENGEEIPHYAVFASVPGEITEADIDWGREAYRQARAA